jgi:MFS family permease
VALDPGAIAAAREPAPEAIGRSSQRARVSVSLIFFVNGLVLASWFVRVPEVKARLAIGDGVLGTLLLALPLGSVAILPASVFVVDRLGSRAATVIAALVLCLAMPLPIISPNLALVALSLGLLGASTGMLDIAMNAQALIVEKHYGRPIMSSCHGFFSVGGLAGSAAAGWTFAIGIESRAGAIAMALVGALMVLAALSGLVRGTSVRTSRGRVFALPGRRLLGLGVLTLFSLLAEFSIGDWSAVYIRDHLRSSAALAAGGYGTFSLAMAAGRLTGDRVVRRLGAGLMLSASGFVAAAGLCGTLMAREPITAIIFCGLVGLGISNAVPILFRAAGSVRGIDPAVGLAAVATTGYIGFLIEPVLIGHVAEAVGLRLALTMVVAACAAIAIAARPVMRSVSADGLTVATFLRM